PLEPVDLPEGGAREDAIELLLPGRLLGVFRRVRMRSADRHDVHFSRARRFPFHDATLSSTVMPSGSRTKIWTVLSRGTTVSRNSKPAARNDARVASRSTQRKAT